MIEATCTVVLSSGITKGSSSVLLCFFCDFVRRYFGKVFSLIKSLCVLVNVISPH